MSALSNQPTNLNYLSPIGFKFAINRTPMFNHFVQTINIPDLSLGSVNIATPFVKLPVPGDQLQFGSLEATFRVDEDMRAYSEIYDWMINLGYPDNFDQYKNVASSKDPQAATTSVGNYSDATLTILSSALRPIMDVQFADIFPIGITSLNFDARSSEVEYLDCIATFAYKKYSIVRL
jgi:hypothetical protein